MGVAATVVALAGLTGLAAGAAVPFVAYRLSVPAGEPPRAGCVLCGQPIPARWVRPGRCGYCQGRLGPPVWSTALATMVTCGLLASVLGWRADLPLYLALAGFGVLLSVIDVACLRLPHELVMSAIGVSAGLFALLAAVTGDWAALLRAMLGAVALGAVFLVLFFLPPHALGLGDVKLAVLLGGFLGWLGWLAVVLGATLPWLFNASVALVLLLSRRIGRKSALPLGPSMFAGALLAVVVAARLDVGAV